MGIGGPNFSLTECYQTDCKQLLENNKLEENTLFVVKITQLPGSRGFIFGGIILHDQLLL